MTQVVRNINVFNLRQADDIDFSGSAIWAMIIMIVILTIVMIFFCMVIYHLEAALNINADVDYHGHAYHQDVENDHDRDCGDAEVDHIYHQGEADIDNHGDL